MNKDKVKGRINEITDKIKEITGKITENKKLEVEGEIQKKMVKAKLILAI
ncbi:hypothetical protein [Candidatus Nitrotoga arctica]|uniref:CsbD-like n=1 Tax=Candidatus Nitrotoga arctica TaxID=453162 RepID=A0ABN8APL5_9PROT|nr:hypothetical protein [Candidatus Nitrotoga arctica]CAG9932482.1 protein of unknown function [Candidatus Nitrotoga arctica]